MPPEMTDREGSTRARCSVITTPVDVVALGAVLDDVDDPVVMAERVPT